ncbi:hypothetical protein Tco_0019179 [Tanacetum coccineum]
MGTRSGPSPIAPTSAVRNTVGQGKEISQGNLNRPASDAALWKYCDKHYNQLLPILAKKMHQEKVQQEKLKAVKARLNFEEVSQHSESGTPSRRRDLRKRLGSRRIRNVSGSPEPRRGRSESPRKRDPERKTVFKRLDKGVFHRLGDKGKSISAYSNDSRRQSRKNCQKVKAVQEDTRSHGQKSKDQALRMTIYPSHGFKIESRDVKGAPEVMRISGFMHGITNPELINRLHDKIPKLIDEMMKKTTSILRREVAADNQERKKSLLPWKQQEAGLKQNFKK